MRVAAEARCFIGVKFIFIAMACRVESVRSRSRSLRHHHHCEPVLAARARRIFSCFQRGLPVWCEPLRRGCAAISVSEWPLVSGRANRADFGSVENFLAFPMA